MLANINTKLDQHPCIITTNEMGAVRHFLKTNLLQRNKQQEICKLYTLHKSNNTQLATMLGQQLIDNALVTAGLVEDPRLVLTGLNKLLEKVLEKY
ncbi:unnamed protein product [Rotaria sordida]|uniref:Uncharacterized protein n=1 Tax=Rotaria sordida TaxID=392033 RepID=A0A818UEC2_9BILA|nr:unnamed protein product [Rotaria sordida]